MKRLCMLIVALAFGSSVCFAQQAALPVKAAETKAKPKTATTSTVEGTKKPVYKSPTVIKK